MHFQFQTNHFSFPHFLCFLFGDRISFLCLCQWWWVLCVVRTHSLVCTQSAGRVCANKPDSTRSVLVSVCTEDLTVLSMANMVLTGFVLYSSLSLAKNISIHLQS